MKSIRRLFMFLCCATLLCAACAPSVLASEAPLSIVCTIFPAYDFAGQIDEQTKQDRFDRIMEIQLRICPPEAKATVMSLRPGTSSIFSRRIFFFMPGVRVTTGWKRSSPLWEKMRPAPSA